MNDSGRLYYGDWKVIDPTVVIKLAVFVDPEKRTYLPRLWNEAEVSAFKWPPFEGFMVSDFFFEEIIEGKKLIQNFRFYTPLENRIRIPNERSEI